jgi:hypothetical protein
MKASGLTNWGAFLITIRGLCVGVLLGVVLRGGAASVPEDRLKLGAAAGLVASVAVRAC